METEYSNHPNKHENICALKLVETGPISASQT